MNSIPKVKRVVRSPGREDFRSGRPIAGVLLVGAVAALAPVPRSAAQAPPGAPELGGSFLSFFEERIRPILAEHCFGCHSARSPRLRGGLHLDGREGWLRGGDLGPAVVPGDPEGSLLIAAVRHDDELLKMPPAGKLDDRQVELLTRWVALGAPGPEEGGAGPVRSGATIDVERARGSWTYRPPEDPPVPDVSDESWPRNGIDRFVLAGLEEHGLSPAPPADRRAWIRRATFDLTGLPPTPEEVDAFLADEAPDAFDRVVDRLLASPRHGERWGRHWLDLARYADSNGLDENVAHGNAWRYRDYVIAAFNADTPYDRFVLEQLAGDLPPPGGSEAEAHARLIATGFLALGPKVLAEVDERKMEMDIVDEQLDTVGRTFLGLTIGCARCHDHKFDPISTADYYAMAGIFKSTRTMETFTKVARWHENALATARDRALRADHERRVAEKKAEIERLSEGRSRRGGDEAADPEDAKAALDRLKEELAALEEAAPTSPTAMGAAEGTVADVPIHIRGSHLTLGEVSPRGVPAVFASPSRPTIDPAGSGRLELARWLVADDHPLTARVMVNRLWRWHFGRGLVGTPDNFGALGEPPSDPRLLDWLARRFVAEGWSIKAMHRLIMGSSTYRMGGASDPDAERIDPENRLRWRMDVRRLEAEAIRDALLAVSGTLDPAMGGSLLEVENRGYFFDHTSRDLTRYDSPRRSVYLPVVRNHLYDMFELFDATDANVSGGDRATTTVAPQALFLMNGDLAIGSAGALAGRLLDRRDLDDGGRIRLLYLLCHARPPEPAESARAEAFLDRIGRALGAEGDGGDPEGIRLGAWQALCQVVLASNEFVTIR